MNFVCKYRNQSFTTGKCLGDHLRADHLSIMNPAVKRREIDEIQVGSDCNGQSSYGLRENPKKSWRVFGQKSRVLEQQSVCDQCGKRFKSDKALFGHMKMHSSLGKRKYKKAIKIQSKYVIRRSIQGNRTQKRYELNPNPSCSNLNEVSCVSDDDEEDLKEIAMCMLMLSKGGFYSPPDSSEVNFVHLQPKLGIIDTQMNDHDGAEVGCDDNGNHDYHDRDHTRNNSEVGFKRVDSDDLKCGNVLLKGLSFNSDSGFMSINPPPDSSEVNFVHLQPKLGIMDTQMNDHDGAEVVCDDNDYHDYHDHDHTRNNSEVGFKRVDSDDLKCGNVLLKEVVEFSFNSHSGFMSINHNKIDFDAIKNVEFNQVNLVLDNHTEGFTGVEMYNHTEKNTENRCKICSKVFQSRQALRGHGLHCPVNRKRSSKKKAAFPMVEEP